MYICIVVFIIHTILTTPPPSIYVLYEWPIIGFQATTIELGLGTQHANTELKGSRHPLLVKPNYKKMGGLSVGQLSVSRTI